MGKITTLNMEQYYAKHFVRCLGVLPVKGPTLPALQTKVYKSASFATRQKYHTAFETNRRKKKKGFAEAYPPLPYLKPAKPVAVTSSSQALMLTSLLLTRRNPT